MDSANPWYRTLTVVAGIGVVAGIFLFIAEWNAQRTFKSDKKQLLDEMGEYTKHADDRGNTGRDLMPPMAATAKVVETVKGDYSDAIQSASKFHRGG